MLSMERAVNKLKKKPDLYLIDGVHAPKKMKNFKTILKPKLGTKGKGCAGSIATGVNKGKISFEKKVFNHFFSVLFKCLVSIILILFYLILVY